MSTSGTHTHSILFGMDTIATKYAALFIKFSQINKIYMCMRVFILNCQEPDILRRTTELNNEEDCTCM